MLLILLIILLFSFFCVSTVRKLDIKMQRLVVEWDMDEIRTRAKLIVSKS